MLKGMRLKMVVAISQLINRVVIMFTEKMLQMVPTTDGFSFCRTFEGENFKVGVMEIPANATKPNKPAGSRTIVITLLV